MNEDHNLIVVEPFSPVLAPTANFTAIVSNISILLKRAKPILELTPEQQEDLDETEIEALIREFKPTKKYSTDISKARIDAKKIMTNMINQKLTELDIQLDQAGFNQLQIVSNKLDQLRKDVLNSRKERRWEDLKAIFTHALDIEPSLQIDVPSLMDFNRFRLQNDKLVSGAKQAEINAKTEQTINTYIHAISEDVNALKALNSPFLHQVLTQYQNNPDLTSAIQYNNQLVQQETARKQAEEARIQAAVKKREQELLAQQQITAQQLAAQQNQQSKLQVSKQSKSDPQNPFNITVESVIAKKYPSVNSDSEKFNAIFDLVQRLGNHDAELLKIIDNPTKSLDAIKLIIGK